MGQRSRRNGRDIHVKWREILGYARPDLIDGAQLGRAERRWVAIAVITRRSDVRKRPPRILHVPIEVQVQRSNSTGPAGELRHVERGHEQPAFERFYLRVAEQLRAAP